MSRFDCPSAALKLGSLLRRTQKPLWIGLALAMVVHLSLTLFISTGEEQKAVKPLTTKFIKRQPRLTKPLEMKKRPRPRRREIQRRMVAVKARETRKQASTGIPSVLLVQNLTRPKVQVGRFVGMDAMELEPEVMAQQIVGNREDKHVVDMALEMVDIEALDTGKYHAMVIQDPTDRRLIRGFFHLLLARPHSLSTFGGRGDGSSVWDDMVIGIHELVHVLNRWTQIRTEIVGQITFDDAELFKVPWVMTPIPNAKVYVTPGEAKNMGRYLSMGGFQFLENAWGVPKLAQEFTTRKIAQDIMASVGLMEDRDWVYERLPKDHPVYHCYYDFDTPPQGEDTLCYYAGKEQGIPRAPMCDYLEGVTLDGRLWILFSQKGYALAWSDWQPYGNYPRDPNRILQFGINTVIFALTQEGSITNQVMDTVRY